MSPMNKMLKLAAVSLLGLGISLVLVQAQSPGISVTPANPTILVGQTQQFTATGMSIPATIDGLSGPIQITLGGVFDTGHSCALMPNRSARCWGDNTYGQLGNGTTTDSTTPVNVTGVGGLTWTSSDATVATIDVGGRATGLRRGVSTIRVTDGLGNTARTTLTVRSLEPLSVAVVVGTGSVSSSPTGIACGADCSEPYLDGTSVTLTAVAAPGSVHTGWFGCDTASGPTCTVTMSAARSVTATFQRVFTLTVTKSGIGAGTVTSSPAAINCGGTCSASYVDGTTVTLTATPGTFSVFFGWTGCDTASNTTWTVRMSAAKSVNAEFLGVPIQ